MLKIYNSSAGSGKTYSLIKEYFFIIFKNKNPYIFKKILIITFTNKASLEIKNRIIKYLKFFSSSKIFFEKNFLLLELCKKLKFSILEIHNISKDFLKIILHNFSNFTISTIDKFLYKIIKTFIYENEFYKKSELEINNDKFLLKCIKIFISKLDKSNETSNFLIKFFLEKFKKKTIINFNEIIFNFSKFILEEKNLIFLKKFKKFNIKKFFLKKKKYDKKRFLFKKHLKKISNKFFFLLKKKKIKYNSFLYSEIPNFFLKLQKGNLFPNPLGKRLQNNINNKKFFSKKKNKIQKKLINKNIKNILKYFNYAKKYYKKNISNYLIYKLYSNNIISLCIIKKILLELDKLKKKKKLLLSYEINKIIYDKISKYSFPYIYEYLGEYYKYYFIDEFQDTSYLQWQNIKFLLENTLSKNGKVIIAGDPKQSIYRWRGGDVEQFINLIKKKSKKYYKKIINLKNNYRSCKEIVKFNNKLYFYASKNIKNNFYKKIYLETIKQKAIIQSKGYVELNFLKEKNIIDYKINICKKIQKKIYFFLNQGYKFSDIVLLIRNKNKGVFLMQELSKYKIPVTSSESILIKNFWQIEILITLLYIILNPYNYKKRVNFILLLNNNNLLSFPKKEIHNLITKIVYTPLNFFFKELSIYGISLNIENIYKKNFYDFIEEIIFSLNLRKKNETAPLQFFLDFVYKFTIKIGNSIRKFLKYWNLEKEKKTIIISNKFESVKIMTIHKSKGLEFPIVIIPFSDWNFFLKKNSNLYTKLYDDNIKNKFEFLYLEFKPFLKKINGPIKKIYKNNCDKEYIDNLNLFYVATTRATEQLIIFSKKKKYKTIFFFLKNFLKKEKIWDEKKNQYCFGKSKKSIFFKKKKSFKQELIFSFFKRKENFLTKKNFKK